MRLPRDETEDVELWNSGIWTPDAKNSMGAVQLVHCNRGFRPTPLLIE